MQNFHRKTCSGLIVLLIVVGITLAGCAARENTSVSKGTGNVEWPTSSGKGDAKIDADAGIKNALASMQQLIHTPAPYFGNTVEISGEVYDTETFRTSIIVRLTDRKIAELLACEFSIEKPPPDLKVGQQVTVIGRVDIIRDVVLLRECRIK